MKVSAEKCTIMGYKCAMTSGALKFGNQTIPVNCLVREVGLNYSCTMTVMEYVLTKFEAGNKLAELPYRTLKLKEDTVQPFRTHVRSILEYCPVAGLNMRQ